MVKDVEGDANAPVDPDLSSWKRIEAEENKKLMKRVSPSILIFIKHAYVLLLINIVCISLKTGGGDVEPGSYH